MEGQIAEKLSVVQEHLPFYIGLGMHLLSAILIIITGWMLGNWADRHISGLKRLDETLSGFLGSLRPSVGFHLTHA